MTRRRLRGTPLLVATTGAAVLACSGLGSSGGGGGGAGWDPPPVGNLMPPPSVQVCVDVTPSHATVQFNGSTAPGNCYSAYDGDVITVTAQASGHKPSEEAVLALSGVRHPIVLEKL